MIANVILFALFCSISRLSSRVNGYEINMSPYHSLSVIFMLVVVVLKPSYVDLQSTDDKFGNGNGISAVEKPDPPKETTLQMMGSGANRVVVFTFVPPDTDFDEYHIRKTTTSYEDSSPSAAITDFTNEDLYFDKSETTVEVPYPESTDGTVTNVSWGIWTRKTGPEGPAVESAPPKPGNVKLLPPAESVNDEET